jgi:MFS family permease
LLNRFLREPVRGSADLLDVGVGVAATASRRLSLWDFLKVIGKTPTVITLMLAFMCENFTTMVLFTWMPTFLYQKYNLSLAAAGLIATIYIQTASMVASPLGGWFADLLRQRTPGGRIIVQGIGILLEAPFVVLCALTHSMLWLTIALILWGLSRGLYEANIFASVFDVVRPEARGTATGFMNTMGWLVGGGISPIVVGFLAERKGLSMAIAVTSLSYLMAGLLLFTGVLFFVRSDAARMEAEIATDVQSLIV